MKQEMPAIWKKSWQNLNRILFYICFGYGRDLTAGIRNADNASRPRQKPSQENHAITVPSATCCPDRWGIPERLNTARRDIDLLQFAIRNERKTVAVRGPEQCCAGGVIRSLELLGRKRADGTNPNRRLATIRRDVCDALAVRRDIRTSTADKSWSRHFKPHERKLGGSAHEVQTSGNECGYESHCQHSGSEPFPAAAAIADNNGSRCLDGGRPAQKYSRVGDVLQPVFRILLQSGFQEYP